MRKTFKQNHFKRRSLKYRKNKTKKQFHKKKTYKKLYIKKGGVIRENNYLMKMFDNLSLDELIDEFEKDLKQCKDLEKTIISKPRVIKTLKTKPTKSLTNQPYDRPICKYDPNCYQKNPEHLKKFAHPSRDEPDNNLESRKYIKDYKDCTDKLIIGSYAIFKKNNGIFPDRFYGIITEYLQASDYTDFRQYHFNVLANMCENMEKYANLYDEPLYKKFIGNFLFVLEEACAVTGMYFTNDFKRCLNKLGLKDQEATFLSNTNLYMSNVLQSIRK